MIIVESIIQVGDTQTKFRASCGHELLSPSPLRVGQSINCILCATGATNRAARSGMQSPSNDEILDALTADYVATMETQGHKFGDPERAAVKRAANIQLAWYAALRRVVG